MTSLPPPHASTASHPFMDHTSLDGEGLGPRIFKIVLTGGPCGGKTTALARLSEFFRTHGKAIPDDQISSPVTDFTCDVFVINSFIIQSAFQAFVSLLFLRQPQLYGVMESSWLISWPVKKRDIGSRTPC